MTFDLKKLLVDVFEPEPGEQVLVACDCPRSPGEDTQAWRERRAMAREWRDAFAAIGAERGFTTHPLLTFAATGSNGAELPATAMLEEKQVSMEQILLASTLTAFLTQYSATAALDGYCRRKEDFRAASLPGLEKRMESTALSADYREVARRCRVLDELLKGGQRLDVSFSTGHSCSFDLRFRKPEVDDGYLPRRKPGDRVINLPSGETFIVPYEGERPGVPSLTSGALPVRRGSELVVLRVTANRIEQVEGEGPEAHRLRELFAADDARRNLAEVAFGCNDWAQVTGNILEDEKAGFHWAFGRSDHLGGTWGVKAFARPETVLHQDIVYARGSPIQVAEAVVAGPSGPRSIIRHGRYVVF
jgi:leucyl aminopeptidase (aminopeptidase T)